LWLSWRRHVSRKYTRLTVSVLGVARNPYSEHSTGTPNSRIARATTDRHDVCAAEVYYFVVIFMFVFVLVYRRQLLRVILFYNRPITSKLTRWAVRSRGCRCCYCCCRPMPLPMSSVLWTFPDRRPRTPIRWTTYCGPVNRNKRIPRPRTVRSPAGVTSCARAKRERASASVACQTRYMWKRNVHHSTDRSTSSR